jgi:hypothetical protein
VFAALDFSEEFELPLDHRQFPIRPRDLPDVGQELGLRADRNWRSTLTRQVQQPEWLKLSKTNTG